MRVHFGLDGLLSEWPESVVCVGTFDGVHRGHAEVVSRAVAEAKTHDLPAIVVTFDRHPAAVLHPDRCPPSLGTLDQQLAAFARLGVGITVVLAFDAALAAVSADEFLERILRGHLRAGRIVVGHDFAFGHGRRGTPEWIAERIPTVVVPPFEVDGVRVSSSHIRGLVAEGRVGEAAELLGRPFAIGGVVVSGERLGRSLGFPTINLARTSNLCLPADGVYAGRATMRDCAYGAAVSIGCRPTVGGRHRTIEAHLLDYPGDSAYGEAVWLELVAWLRAEEAFADLDDLTAQMTQDVRAARDVLQTK